MHWAQVFIKQARRFRSEEDILQKSKPRLFEKKNPPSRAKTPLNSPDSRAPLAPFTSTNQARPLSNRFTSLNLQNIIFGTAKKLLCY